MVRQVPRTARTVPRALANSQVRATKTPSAAIEWRENGHRLSLSLGHRDWAWTKTQADQFAADFNGPEFHGEVPAEPEPLTLETRIS